MNSCMACKINQSSLCCIIHVVHNTFVYWHYHNITIGLEFLLSDYSVSLSYQYVFILHHQHSKGIVVVHQYIYQYVIIPLPSLEQS